MHPSPGQPDQEKLFAGENAARTARQLLATIDRVDTRRAVGAAREQMTKVDPKLADEKYFQKAAAKAESFFDSQTPTAERLAECIQLVQLPFFHLTAARQKEELQSGFDTAALFFLVAHPGLASIGLNLALTDLQIKYTRPSRKRQIMEGIKKQQLTAFQLDPSHNRKNAGWNDYHYMRYCILGQPEDLRELVRRYAGDEPADVPERGFITTTARWMVNSLMQQYTWFNREFTAEWKEGGDPRTLPIDDAGDILAEGYALPTGPPGLPN